METKILLEIVRLVNIYDNYEFDFDGEKVASDVRLIEGQIPECSFDLGFTISVTETTWFGLQLEDIDIFEFNVFNEDGDLIKVDITEKQIEESILIF